MRKVRESTARFTSRFAGSLWVSCLGISAILSGCGLDALPTEVADDGTTDENTVDSPEHERMAGESSDTKSASVDIALDELEPLIRNRAEYYLRSFRNTPAAPTWSPDAALDGYARALYLPGMEEPAYYEFSVTEGGYFVISTAPHDSPLTNLSYKGTRATQRLIDQAHAQGKRLGRLYKLGTLRYAGEDENGELVAGLGMDATISTHEWSEAKLKAIEDYGEMLGQVSPGWEQETRSWSWEPLKTPVFFGTIYKAYRSSLFDQIDLYQWQDHEARCMIGCGPVAWGILTAYMDYLAETDFSLLAYQPAMYRAMNAGALLPGGANKENFVPGKAPNGGNEIGANPATKNAIRGIRNRTSGFCTTTPIPNMTYVFPNLMHRYTDWANDKGAYLAVEQRFGRGAHTVSFAKNKILYQDPVLLGIATNPVGLLDHYVVAHKQMTFNGDDQFYVNNGWAGDKDDQWISASQVFYAVAVVNP